VSGWLGFFQSCQKQCAAAFLTSSSDSSKKRRRACSHQGRHFGIQEIGFRDGGRAAARFGRSFERGFGELTFGRVIKAREAGGDSAVPAGLGVRGVEEEVEVGSDGFELLVYAVLDQTADELATMEGNVGVEKGG
jgi:hypothetical protein